MNIHKGQRLLLTQFCPETTFQIGLQILGIKASIDYACFGLDALQKLSDDAYMIFFNQPKTPCGALELSTPAGDAAGFLCQLNKLPTHIDRLVFTATVDSSETMQQIQTGYLRFMIAGQETARFTFSGADFQQEKALMLGELYRKEGGWRFNAIAQGFNGGLDALVKHFGGEVAEEKPEPPLVKPLPAKVTLEKRGDNISLKKTSGSNGYGRIVCNLNWTSGSEAKKGFLNRTSISKGIDLDLACLYELADGSKFVVQALGNCFGSYEKSPFLQLAGDDRSGANIDGEFLYINGDHFNDIRRLCVFCFIYEGAANWTLANALATVNVPGHPMIEVRLDGHQNHLNTCSIAMIENDRGELKLTKLSEYFQSHQDLDKHYNWGMSWQVARK